MSVRSRGIVDDANKYEIVRVGSARILLRRADGDGVGTAEQAYTCADQTSSCDTSPSYD